MLMSISGSINYIKSPLNAFVSRKHLTRSMFTESSDRMMGSGQFNTSRYFRGGYFHNDKNIRPKTIKPGTIASVFFVCLVFTKYVMDHSIISQLIVGSDSQGHAQQLLWCVCLKICCARRRLKSCLICLMSIVAKLRH